MYTYIYVASHKNCDRFAIKSVMILSCLTIIIQENKCNEPIHFYSFNPSCFLRTFYLIHWRKKPMVLTTIAFKLLRFINDFQLITTFLILYKIRSISSISVLSFLFPFYVLFFFLAIESLIKDKIYTT